MERMLRAADLNISNIEEKEGDSADSGMACSPGADQRSEKHVKSYNPDWYIR